MSTKLMKFALAATIAFGASAVMAQDMGIGTETEKSSDSALHIDEISPNDQGVIIVEEVQKKNPGEIVKIDANIALQNWLKNNNYAQGYNDERGYFLQIGVARDSSIYPTDDDFLTKRELLYREALLRAKVDICGLVEREMSGGTWKRGLSNDDVRKFEKKHQDEIQKINEAKRKISNMMLNLNRKEAEVLKGVTTTDRINELVDTVIKRLDNSYSKGKIEQEKIKEFEDIKKAYAEVKLEMDILEEKKSEMFPVQTVEAKVDSAVRIKLHGAVPIHQTESYIGDEFQVAVAVLWSPKLGARAEKMMLRKAIEKGTATEDRTLTEYLDANKASLPVMVGARQYVDKNGKVYFLGISAQELPTDVLDKDDAISFADQMAMHAVIMSLYTEGRGITSAAATLAKRKGKNGDVLKALAENSEESLPKNFSVGGLGKVYSYLAKYEITGKPMYISVAAIDSTLAAKSPTLKKLWDDRAKETVTELNTIAYERNQVENEYQAAKQKIKQKKVVMGTEKKNEKVVLDQSEVPQDKPAPSGIKRGVFGGKAKHSDDF